MTLNCGKAMYTVLFTGSEAGEYLPLQFLFKGNHFFESALHFTKNEVFR